MTEPSAHQVVEAELVWVRLPLLVPLRSAHGVEQVRDLVLVRLGLADGAIGWGECSALGRPTYSAEYTSDAWRILRDELVPALLAGRDPGVVGHPMAQAALAVARSDAALRRRDRRLVDELGARHGRPAERVATTAVEGRAVGTDELLARVSDHVDRGAAMVKLKVTPHPEDLDAVAVVRATWPDLAVAVDGNGSLDRRSASVLDGLGLIYIEQPLPSDDLVGSAALAGRLATPIALDESISSLASLETAMALGSATVVNVKPARLGGVHQAAELAHAAADAGWGVFVGGMLESGVGRAVALAVAALPLATLPTDVGPSSRYVLQDVTEPIEADEHGRVVVPVGAGIGVTPLPDRLDAMATDRLIVGR